MTCPLYEDERQCLFNHASSHDPGFNVLTNEEKFVYLLSNHLVISKCALTLRNILRTRLHHTSRVIV